MTTAVKSPVSHYAEAVVSGSILTGRLVRLACERHLRDLKRDDLLFDAAAAQRALDFFPFLSLSGGDQGDKPFTLEPWQAFIVGSLFGWKLLDGSRRYRVAYIEAAKGCGKSPLAAGIGLYMLVADGEDRAEIYAAAHDKEQAQVVFRNAVAMVDRSESLAPLLQRSGGKGKEWNLAYLETGSFFRPMSAEHTAGRGKSGFRVHCGLLDEVHEHPTSAMVDFMRANAKGRQPLIFEITNSGYDRTSVCFQHHQLSVKVLEGALENDAWFAYVCGLDPCATHLSEGKVSPEDGCEDCDDWRDESVWIKANPNLDVSISRRYVRELVAEAVAMPSKRNIVQRLNFCIWNASHTRWITDELWKANEGVVDAEALKGQTCNAGIVIRSTYDLAALVLAFEGGELLPFFWVPEERIPERREAAPYDVWVGEGHITATPGNAVDYATIRKKVNDLRDEYDIREVAVRGYNLIQMETELIDDGFEVTKYSGSMQAMSPPTKEFQRRLSERLIQHGGNPVMTWMASNISVKIDADENMRPDPESSLERFEGIEAAIIAIGRELAQNDGEAGVFFA